MGRWVRYLGLSPKKCIFSGTFPKEQDVFQLSILEGASKVAQSASLCHLPFVIYHLPNLTSTCRTPSSALSLIEFMSQLFLLLLNVLEMNLISFQSGFASYWLICSRNSPKLILPESSLSATKAFSSHICFLCCEICEQKGVAI